MRRYETAVLLLSPKDIHEADGRLADMGRRGWRLVAVLDGGFAGREAWMEREVGEVEPAAAADRDDGGLAWLSLEGRPDEPVPMDEALRRFAEAVGRRRRCTVWRPHPRDPRVKAAVAAFYGTDMPT